MAVRVFLSSVQTEFAAERDAIRHQIQRLGESCVCMERFGAVPVGPRSHDDDAVAGCDLFVCLVGSRYGSVEPATGKSYTELEFEAAQRHGVPCLVYLKISDESPEASQEVFRDRLKAPDRIIAQFRGVADLQDQFVVDFVRELRTTLLEKFALEPLGPLSWTTIHGLTAGLLDSNVALVGGDRYVSSLYIRRDVENAVDAFVNADETYRMGLVELVGDLRTVADAYGLAGPAATALDELAEASQNEGETHAELIRAVKNAFRYNQVGSIIQAIDKLPRCLPLDAVRTVDGVLDSVRQAGFVTGASTAELRQLLYESRRRGSTTRAYGDLLKVFPSRRAGLKSERLANDLLDDLERLVERANARCLAVVSRAGTGKTTLLCGVAKRLIADYPVVLLPGSMNLSGAIDIDEHVERYLATSFGRNLSNWIVRTAESLRTDHKRIFVLIDAINEAPDATAMRTRLRSFVIRIKPSRVRLVVSCRDVGWQQFESAFESALAGEALSLDAYSDTEWNTVISRYFEHFDISATLTENARASLRSPLLLRFFCLVHRGQQVGDVNAVSLATVFDALLRRLRQSADEQLGPMQGPAALDMITGTAMAMWTARRRVVTTDEISQAVCSGSIRNHVWYFLRSEGVFSDASAASLPRAAQRCEFSYDEFMEFALGRAWIEAGLFEHTGRRDGFLEEVIASIPAFPAATGGLIYADEALHQEGRLINRALVSSRHVVESLVDSHQVPLLYLLESAHLKELDASTLAILDRFEVTATTALRERLGLLAVRLLEAQPASDTVRTVVRRILEADGRVISEPEVSTHGPAGWTCGPESCVPHKMKYRLPPARHHYSEDTRLAAIGLLIAQGDSEAERIAHSAIDRVGNVELHTALEALRALDGSSQELLCRSVRRYIEYPLPEYRIYCAWLLRERYGRQPAELMIRLITDHDARVHEYALRLFDHRLIEPGLIDCAVEMLEAGALPGWHRASLVRLLARRDRLAPAAVDWHEAIVACAKTLTTAADARVRLEAYRCLLVYSEWVSISETLQAARTDTDRYVRSVAIAYDRRQLSPE